MRDRTLAVLAWVLMLLQLSGCGREDGGPDNAVVFRHAKMFGDSRAFETLIEGFERNTGIVVRRETLPAASDEQHLFYAINFQARSTDFDLLALDVVWLAEFAQAGWLRHLPTSESDREDFFPGVQEALQWRGKTYARPWFIDAGLLYYRKDLLEQYGFAPPQTWDDLRQAAGTIVRAQPDLAGFVWQGKQYEGLVCNALEFLWSMGGDITKASHARANIAGLTLMRTLVTEGVSPATVTTFTEEPARTLFGRGRAVFLRNWPYAWHLFEREGSAVRGRVGVSPLPRGPEGSSSATLGGWQLGVSAFSRRPAAAEQLARFLSSAQAHMALALAYGYSPPRRSLYEDAELVRAQPFLSSLREVFEGARPRPVSARYVAFSQVLQSQFSAVLTGVREPADALDAIGEARKGMP